MKLVAPLVFQDGTSQSTAPTGSGAVVAETFAGRSFPKFSGDISEYLQTSLGFKKIALFMPGEATTVNYLGYMSAGTTGTATGRYSNPAATTLFGRMKRYGIVSAATAGSFATVRIANESFSLGNGSAGGFLTVTRFGCADAATVAGARQFVGMQNSTAVSNVEPSTMTNCIGVGHGAADTNLKLFYGGTAAQTPIDLGANFPANTLSADVYELVIYSPRTQTNVVYWKVTRMNTGDTAEGTINGTAVTVPNGGTIAICPFRAWRCNNATALAVGLDIFHNYSETDY